MKRGIQKVLAMGLSIALFTELFSFPTGAETVVEKPAVSQETETVEGVYRQGEALVLFRSDAAGQKSEAEFEDATGALLAKADMTVEEILTFGEAQENGEEPTKSGRTEETCDETKILRVGVITSDTLSTEDMIQKLSKEKDIELAEPNYIYHADALTNDALSEYQWSLENDGQNGGIEGADIHPDGIWSGADTGAVTTGTEDVIAVVDSGMDFTHPDLEGVAWQNNYQGVLPGEHGYDFVNCDDNPQDDNGHGTHCSGIIAAVGNNEIGISGVNQKAKLMALKVLDASGYGSQENIISAYQYIYRALQLGVRVVAVNNSWDGSYGEILTRVINKVGEAGAISVFAAGNDGKNIDMDINNEEIPSEQSKLNSPYAITVAATNEKDELAFYSNYGKKSVTLAAPGTDILSTTAKKEVLTPGILTPNQRADTCILYQSYDQLVLPEYTKQDNGSLTTDADVPAGMPNRIELHRSAKELNTNALISVSLDENTYVGTKGGKSLHVSVSGAQKGDMLYIMIPYEAPAQQKINPKVSAMVQAYTDSKDKQEVSCFMLEDCTEEEMEELIRMHSIGCYMIDAADVQDTDRGIGWSQLCGENEKRNMSRYPQKRYIVLQGSCSKEGNYQFYVDDLAVSNGMETQENTDFGRYEYLSGTSMAVPHVTGAVALVAAAYKERSPKELVNCIKSSVRKTPELEEKTASGGVLDLSQISRPVPFLSDAVYKKDGKLHLYGYGFLVDDTVVKVDDTQVKAKVLGDTELAVEGDWFQNTCADITVTTNYGTTTKTFYLVKGKNAYQEHGELGGYAYGGEESKRVKNMKENQILTDGTNIFFYEALGGNISQIVITEGKSEDDWISDNYAEVRYRFDLSETLNADGVQELEDHCFAVSNLVYLNGHLYFLMSRQEEGDVSKQISLVSYEIKSQTGIEIGQLPKQYQNRSEMTLGVCKGKLYVIGGYDYGKKDMIKDVLEAKTLQEPVSWKSAPSLPMGRAGGVCTQDGDELYYALGMANPMESCPQTLAFDGKKWRILDGTLDALTVEKKEFKETIYQMYRGNIDIGKEGILFTGLPCNGLGDTFYQNKETGAFTLTTFNCVEDVKNEAFVGTLVGSQLFGLAADDCSTIVRTQKIGSNLVPVKTSMKGNGTIKVTPRACLPGDTVTITAVPKKGAYLKKLTVNGKKISKESVKQYALGSINVKAEFGTYVQSIQIKKQKSKTNWKLKAVIKPSNADKKTVRWISDNTKYATISAKGIITVKQKGIGKKVCFTAIAKDGSKVKTTFQMKLS
ncbi:MAG: S8 family serine peptidase [Lachnospiraceae bacterium]